MIDHVSVAAPTIRDPSAAVTHERRRVTATIEKQHALLTGSKITLDLFGHPRRQPVVEGLGANVDDDDVRSRGAGHPVR